MEKLLVDFMAQLADDSRDILSEAQLTMRNDVGMVSVNLPIRTEELQKIIAAVHEPTPKLFISFHGLNSISFIMERQDLQLMLKEIRRDDIITYREDLATIHISTPKTMRTGKGILSFIGLLMSKNNISVEAGEFCEGDAVLVLQKTVAPRAYELLMNSIDYMRKKNDTVYRSE